MRGQDAVIVSAAEFEHMRGESTGQAFVDAFQRCPHHLEIERIDASALLREIDL